MAISGVKALAFDVFGTVVDYRGTIIREGERLNRTKGLQVDWAAFADAWRARYRPSMDRVMQGTQPWTTLDALHRQSLDELLLQQELLEHFSEEEKERLNHVWHRLQPWPDTIPGLTHLRKRYTLATLSNGNIALLVDMARYSALPWDCILSAELAHAYKPDPRVYQVAITLLSPLQSRGHDGCRPPGGSARCPGAGDADGLCSTLNGAWSTVRAGSGS